MNKIMLWIVTLLAAAFLLFPNYVGALIGTAGGGNIDAAMTRSVVTIEGMTCEGCAAIVAKAIHAVPGVLAVEVDYADREAVIGTEGCCPVPKEQILAALAAAGYRGRFATDGVVATGAEGDTADCCPVLKAPAEPGEPSTR